MENRHKDKIVLEGGGSPFPPEEEPCPLSLAYGFLTTQPSPDIGDNVAGEIPRVFTTPSLSVCVDQRKT